MLSAKDLMSKTAIVVPEELQITELTKLLREKRISGAPVIDKGKKICGLVTVTDLFNAMRIIRQMNSNKAQWLSILTPEKKAIAVKEIYTRKFYSVLPDTPVEKIVDLMMEKGLHTIPVMDESQTELYGVIGRHDITWAVFGDTSQQPNRESASDAQVPQKS